MLLPAFRGMSQVIWNTVDFGERFPMEYSCTVRTDFAPQGSEAILEYLRSKTTDIDDYIESHCSTAMLTLSITNSINENEACYYGFNRLYLVNFVCEGVLTQFTYKEHFHVFKMADPDEYTLNYVDEELLTYDYGYYEEDLPPERSFAEIVTTFPDIQSSCGETDNLTMEVVMEPGEDRGCEKEYRRTYTFTDNCTLKEVGKVTEIITMITELKIHGHLKALDYDRTKERPAPYTTLAQLKQAGARFTYSREEANLKVSSIDVETSNPNIIKRKYVVTPTDCNEISDTITQLLKSKAGRVMPFTIWYQDATVEGADDGYLEIIPPEQDEGCFDTPDNPNQWYRVVLINQSEEMAKTYEFPETQNIYEITDLKPGEYTMNIYATCESCHFYSDAVYRNHFKIKTRKMEVKVVDGLGLYSNHKYLSFNAVVNISGPNNEYVVFEEYDKIVGRFHDEWELSEGYLYSPKVKEWDLFEMHNQYMGGFGQYENILWQYQMLNEQFSHGLQRMVVTKDVGDKVFYRLYKNIVFENEEDSELYREAHKKLYKEEFWCSNDPNEIFGPVGYTDPDSVCVHMINTTDDVGYTIMFENDPELATAAAARVKVICPLSEKVDPTTFRLGNFGFNNMTFEVPEMASYYNKRIMMDSLGYWLDVTASIQAPENYAYWIFQTIDPETGVAPNDSLGFLPVNDTLTGCGEGFVTFTVGLAKTNSRGLLHTGDSIMENAEIYFDENEVVPTNDYVNQFDGMAPTSHIVCDTNGAYANRYLDIRFDAADDTGGSGLKNIELYVNTDKAGYQLEATVEPDSTYRFFIKNGTNFEFFGLAVDNVNNKEAYKTVPELYYSTSNPPYDLLLSNSSFNEDAASGTVVGYFTTFDDQNTDNFQYDLVLGDGSTDNGLFYIDGDALRTNNDFICYGQFEYSIRVRTTDLTNAYLEKEFVLQMNQTEKPEMGHIYYYLCPGESITINGEDVTSEGIYYDTISSYRGCDSVVCTRVVMNPAPITTLASDMICYGYDYEDNGFSLSADQLAELTTGWTLASDTTLYLDNYVENATGCFDTTRLTLTLHPSYNFVEDAFVCPSDLPYYWQNAAYLNDTTISLKYLTERGCDSIHTLQLTINPNTGDQSDDLALGWNWYSTYLDQSNGKGLVNLQNALGTSGNSIKSQTQIVNYSGGSWFGALEELDNASMYKIQMNESKTVDLSGCLADVVATTIDLNPGWSWIGFPSATADYVNHALTGLSAEPVDGDMIKSLNSFALYYESYNTWFGSLNVLTPGAGYMYQSHNTQKVTLTYPESTRTHCEYIQMPPTYWTSDARQHAQNITFVGVVELDGNILDGDDYEVGVFCGEEQRGSGRALFLPGPDIYRIFITAHGEEGDKLNFRLYDHDRNKERRILCNQEVVFHADATYGDFQQPYRFVFNTAYDHHIVADICEGQSYNENGFRVNETGTYYKELTGVHGNDSIVRLDLTVNPVFSRESDLVAFDFPYHYEGFTFEKPGTFTFHLESEHTCDSTLVFHVHSYDGERELVMSPVPAKTTDRVVLFYPFTNDEQKDLQVDVFTLAGSLLQSIKPNRYPIELDEIRVSGTYTVRITMGTGEVLTGKIIVQ